VGFDRLHMIMGLQCNARCVMCYQTDFSAKYNMPPEVYREHLKPIYAQIKSVKLQGGEPTIMKNCKDFCEVTQGYPDMRISLTTNGIYLNRFWQDTLAERGHFINVSLNAASQAAYDQIVKHGDFDKVLNNIRTLAARVDPDQTRLALSMVILPQNILEITDFIKLGIDLGASQVGFGLDPVLSLVSLPPADKLHVVLERAFELLDQSGIESEGLQVAARRLGYPLGPKEAQTQLPGCRMPFFNLVVDEKGDVRICCETWRVLGNTYRQSINEILEGGPLIKFQRKVKRNDYIWCDPKCPDNPNPHRLAQLDKYVYLMRRDPFAFANKVKHKLARLRKIKSPETES
jgi:sulfatase maturation enzyme AslB (radical SAM superfamily)